MSLMSVVEFFELALDLVIYAIIHFRLKRQLAARQQGGPPRSNVGARMPWEPPPPGRRQFAYLGDPPPSYRAATRMSRAFPNDVRDVMLNL